MSMKEMKEWAQKEVEIACERERDNAPEGEWVYGCGCYESALKAFESLMSDGHSGMSISITHNILNRLIEGRPLSPIEDTDDIWSDVTNISGLRGERANYQCERMSSLFKDVYSDGTITYTDINRTQCVSIDSPTCTYYSGMVGDIIDDLFPITMPYYPGKPYRVYCEDFLYDAKNGDYDTVGVLYAINPSGDRVEINKFFKEENNQWVEIDEKEYYDRKEKPISI